MFLEDGMVSWRGLFYLDPYDYSLRWEMIVAPLSGQDVDNLRSECSYWEPILTVARLTDTHEWYVVRKELYENRLYVYHINPEKYTEVEVQIEIPWTKSQVEYLYQLEAGDLDGDGVNELVSSFRGMGGEFHIGIYRWNGATYEAWLDTQLLPRDDKWLGGCWGDYSIWLGDVDTDGKTEILTEDGHIYKWDGDHLVLWDQLREIIENPGKYGGDIVEIMNIAVENIDDDGQNEIIILTGGISDDYVFVAQIK
jgi:hypothetical protein